MLIAGGQGKGQDFSALREPAARYLRAAVLVGEDAPVIAEALQAVVPTENAGDMQAAVRASRGRIGATRRCGAAVAGLCQL